MTHTLLPNFSIRPPTMDDLSAVTKLLVTCEITDYGVPETTTEFVSFGWQDPSFELATDAWMVLAPDGEVVAYADIGHHEYVHFYIGVFVHPDYRKYGIGSYLLQQAENRAYQLMSYAPPQARVVITITLSANNLTGRRVLEHFGYQIEQSYWRMDMFMQEPPQAPRWPAGITVRSFIPGQDEQTVFNVVEESFQDVEGHVPWKYNDWLAWMFKREHVDPSLYFLAFEGEELVGVCLCQRDLYVGYVSQLAVRRPWRRKGLGTALLLHAFGEFYYRGERNVCLCVEKHNLEGAGHLYERVGMTITRQDHTYEKEIRPAYLYN